MTIEDAKVLVLQGVVFGDVYTKIEWSSRDDLREWYCTTHGLPNLKGRELLKAHQSGYTGDSCTKCGSTKTVRTGTCFVCMECGESGGCG